MKNNLQVLSIIGPTAIGKSTLALELCKKYPFEIVSVDSSMIYRDMNIGTDKPSEKILSEINHHLVNIRNPDEEYNVGQFFLDCKKSIQDIHKKNKTPLLVGGSFMYLNQIYNGMSLLPNKSMDDRIFLNRLLDKYSCQDLHQCLKNIDKDSYSRIDKNDKQRVERALEVFMSTGKPMSYFFNEKVSILNDFRVLTIKLVSEDRKILHNKIKSRIKHMFSKGFIEEVSYVTNKYSLSKESQSMKSIGYREIFAYLTDNLDINDLEDKCLFSTRQLAKRQLTWLRQFKDCYEVKIMSNRLEKMSVLIDKHLQFI